MPMTDLVSITLQRGDDTGPLEMISRDRLERLQAVERAAKRAVAYRHEARGAARIVFDDLARVLHMGEPRET
jgi:hypothetical protein